MSEARKGKTMENRNRIAPSLEEFTLGVIVLVLAILWLAAAVVVPAALIKLCWLFLLA